MTGLLVTIFEVVRNRVGLQPDVSWLSNFASLWAQHQKPRVWAHPLVGYPGDFRGDFDGLTDDSKKSTQSACREVPSLNVKEYLRSRHHERQAKLLS